ncbi:MAG TPA: diguanylate cyclase [Dongiaceae bacterium]|nr:diguanylate cyclase [Dongiaceae bacterium]
MKLGGRRIKLRSEMAIWVAAMAMTLTLALTVISVVTITRYIERESHDDVAILANDVAQAFDHRMSQNFRMSSMVDGLDFLRQTHISPAAKRALLANLQTVFPDCVWIGIVGTDGIVQVSGDSRREGDSVADEPWFVEGLRQPMITALRQPIKTERVPPLPGDDQRVINIARPLRDPLGNLIGVIDVAVSSKWAVEFLDLLLRNRNAAVGIDIIITDRDGRVLIGPPALIDQPLLFTTNPAASEGVPGVFSPGRNGMSQASGASKAALTSALHFSVAQWPDGGDYISAVGTGTGYQDFPGLHWNIVVRQPRDIAYAPAYAIRTSLIITGIALAILFAGIGWVAADRITNSIRQLTRHADRLESGERGIAFPSGSGNAEVAVLGETLDHLVANLLQREQQLLDLNANLEQRIVDRTALLASSNRQLQDEIAQRQAAENARETLIHQLRDQAEHDPLTGALNRRAFLAMAERDRRRLRREGGRLAVIMFDIDHFKRVNDNYGHGTGDEVIRQIAAIARQTVRDTDLLCRYGGEEFAVLISDPDARNAVAVAERLRRSVAALKFSAMPQQAEAGSAAQSGAQGETSPASFQVAISLGVTIAAANDLPEGDLDSLLEHADQALYMAKRSGRNRTVIDPRVASLFDRAASPHDHNPQQAANEG